MIFLTSIFILIFYFNSNTINKKSTFLRMCFELNPATTYPPGPFPAKYYQRAEA